MRLAWFSPLPPVRSGISACSAGLIGALRAEHDIDVFVDDPVVGVAPPPRPGEPGRPVRVRSAHDFVWEQRRVPYDLAVYQLGNSSHHDYAWPYLFRYPGLAVLHDAHLHHARAAALLRERRVGHYRAEFAANQPDTSPDAAELAVAGFDSHLLYQWPFTRLVVRASRMTAVHSRLMQGVLAGENPGATVELIRLGHGTALSPDAIASRRAAARTRFGIPSEALLFGCFGGLSPDKRIPQVLGAFQSLLPYAPSARLVLAGAAARHYDVVEDVRRRGLAGQVILTGYLESDDELTDAIAACDVTLNLRWPTAREVSGPWLQCLAAGRPSIVIDLVHTADIPMLDPRTWTVAGGDTRPPVAIAIDIMDEDHSQRLAMRRLAGDPAWRDALGRAARAHWDREHAHGVMLRDYQRLLPLAAAAPPPAGGLLPPHLRHDRSHLVDGILGDLGVPVPWSKI
jgi:glycosyltransferase involved in cell wall biosynthesis